jgi:hypothetical protein
LPASQPITFRLQTQNLHVSGDLPAISGCIPEVRSNNQNQGGNLKRVDENVLHSNKMDYAMC